MATSPVATNQGSLWLISPARNRAGDFFIRFGLADGLKCLQKPAESPLAGQGNQDYDYNSAR
jgi:hypothetical protein